MKYFVLKLAIVSHSFRVQWNAGIKDTRKPNEDETKLFRSNTSLSGVVGMDRQTLVPPDFVLTVGL